MSIITKDYVYKIALVGDSSTGKSSLIKRYADDHFQQTYQPTIGVDFKFKTLEVNQTLVKLQIWDTAGQQRFRNITSAYYKNAQGIIIVFDVNNWKSFQSIQNYWLKEVKKYGEQGVQIVLMGNKIDKCLQIIESRIEKFEQKHNMKVFLCSAKTGQNVKQAFQYLTQLCINSFRSMEKQLRERYMCLQSVDRKNIDIHLRSRTFNLHKRRKQKPCC